MRLLGVTFISSSDDEELLLLRVVTGGEVGCMLIWLIAADNEAGG